MSELEEKLALLKQKRDHVDLFGAADVNTLVEGIEYAMSHGGDVSVAVTPVENGYKITVTDSEGNVQEATVQNGGDAYEVYKTTVPEDQTPMSKTEWLASLKGEKGEDAVNPFKGWYKTGDTLPTIGATGDYLYFKNTTGTPATTTIYRWNGSVFADTETEVDESNVQTFETGQSVNAVGIDASELKNAGSSDLPKATDVQLLKQQLRGVTLEETKKTYTEYKAIDNVYGGYYYLNNGTLSWNTDTSGSFKSAKIEVNGYNSVRFLAYVKAGSTASSAVYVWLDSSNNVISYTRYDNDSELSETALKEYVVKNPGAYYLVTFYKYSELITSANFYCYAQNGEGVIEIIDKKADYIQTKFNDFRIGSISSGVAIYDPNKKYLISLYLLKCSEIHHITINANCRLIISYYNDDMSFDRLVSVSGGLAIIDKSKKYFRLNISKVDGTAFSESSLNTTLSNMNCTLWGQGIETLKDKSFHGSDLLTIFSSSLIGQNVPENVGYGTSGYTAYPFARESANDVRGAGLDMTNTTIKPVNQTNLCVVSQNPSTISIVEGHKYLTCLRIKVVSYTAKTTQWNFATTAVQYPFLAISGIGGTTVNYGKETNGEYVNVVGIRTGITTEGKSVSIGYRSTDANTFGACDFEISDAIVLDLTELGLDTVPLPKLAEMYNDYTSVFIKTFDKKRQVDIVSPTTISKVLCVEEMNKYASELGCQNTNFSNPSGVSVETHKTTPNDYCRIISSYAQNNKLLRINNYPSVDIIIYNANGTTTTETIGAPYSKQSAEQGEHNSWSDLGQYYYVLGGKGGSWTESPNMLRTLAILAKSNNSDKLMCAYVKCYTTKTVYDNGEFSTYALIKAMFDGLENNTTPDFTNVWNISYASNIQYSVGYVPYNAHGCKNTSYTSFSSGGDTQLSPASTTKLTTCLLACELFDLNEVVEVNGCDITGGSGLTLSVGCKMTMRDAIMACLYTSSNTLASTIGRMFGERIYQQKILL